MLTRCEKKLGWKGSGRGEKTPAYSLHRKTYKIQGVRGGLKRESVHSMQGGLERLITLTKNLTQELTDTETPQLTMRGDYLIKTS